MTRFAADGPSTGTGRGAEYVERVGCTVDELIKAINQHIFIAEELEQEGRTLAAELRRSVVEGLQKELDRHLAPKRDVVGIAIDVALVAGAILLIAVALAAVVLGVVGA